MSESTKDTIEINNPEYNFLPKNFLESVKDVFGNIKIDIELDINNETINSYIFILMTKPFYFKVTKVKRWKT